MDKIITYTDGSSRGNPGPAAIGVYITDATGKVIHEAKESIGNATDNYAEYYAVVVALEIMGQILGENTNTTKVELCLSSELVQKQLSGLSQIKEPGLVSLFIEIHNLQVASFPHVTFIYVSKDKNNQANQLVSEVLDGK